MLDKLQAIEDKYLDLEAKISDPDIIADQKEWQKCCLLYTSPSPRDA